MTAYAPDIGSTVLDLEGLGDGERRLIWALRHVAAARSQGMPVPEKVADSFARLGDGKVAGLIDLVCALVEDRLGRPLDVGCCCDLRTTPDERALLTTLSEAAHGPQIASRTMPHGWMGVLGWAARALVDSFAGLGLPLGGALPVLAAQAPRCPFRAAVLH
jgi:hypothetical protein